MVALPAAPGCLMPPILDARGLNKSFGAVTAASDINAAIEKDSVVGLIGTNGAGKTTFINMITGYLKPDRGAIHFEGRDITRLGICRSFQIPQLYSSLTVEENMGVALGVVLQNARLGGFFSTGEPGASSSDTSRRIRAAAIETLSRSILSTCAGHSKHEYLLRNAALRDRRAQPAARRRR